MRVWGVMMYAVHSWPGRLADSDMNMWGRRRRSGGLTARLTPGITQQRSSDPSSVWCGQGPQRWWWPHPRYTSLTWHTWAHGDTRDTGSRIIASQWQVGSWDSYDVRGCGMKWVREILSWNMHSTRICISSQQEILHLFFSPHSLEWFMSLLTTDLK